MSTLHQSHPEFSVLPDVAVITELLFQTQAIYTVHLPMITISKP